MSDDRIPTATTGGPTATPDLHLPQGAAVVQTLRQVDELTSRTRHAGRWYARYMAVFGGGFGLMTLLLGLGPDADAAGLWWALALMAVWAVFVAGMVVWAFRRPVQGDLQSRTYVPGWVGTGVLYAAALFVGLGQDLPVWAWVLAALVVPLPLVASAVRVHRSLA